MSKIFRIKKTFTSIVILLLLIVLILKILLRVNLENPVNPART